jgi:two-component system, response regulator PdtaR
MDSEKLTTILIVEDEFIIALGAAETFHRAGFETIEASNADDAVAILEARNDIGVVFTDVRMPGSMDGLKLAHCVRDRWPPVKIIVTSGHHSVRPGDLPDGGLFIPKPYSDQCLTAAVGELIPI